jgi:hypothetical protein
MSTLPLILNALRAYVTVAAHQHYAFSAMFESPDRNKSLCPFPLAASYAHCSFGSTKCFPAGTTITVCYSFLFPRVATAARRWESLSTELDRFADRLSLDSKIVVKFRNSRFRSVELLIQKLYRVARIAQRRGRAFLGFCRRRWAVMLNEEPFQ